MARYLYMLEQHTKSPQTDTIKTRAGGYMNFGNGASAKDVFVVNQVWLLVTDKKNIITTATRNPHGLEDSLLEDMIPLLQPHCRDSPSPAIAITQLTIETARYPHPRMTPIQAKDEIKELIGSPPHLVLYCRCLSAVDGVYAEWWEIATSQPKPTLKIAQPNTFVNDDGEVELRLYEESNEGIIQSWAERNV
ncbi:uncharacterized protein BDV17DRAFT_295805 [Aspergillus undulatus]|uniref:uncharacterized protein n=1 Tax=Aspergillus undulatus TaxID=1810928 RepID=UPI003CCCE34B